MPGLNIAANTPNARQLQRFSLKPQATTDAQAQVQGPEMPQESVTLSEAAQQYRLPETGQAPGGDSNDGAYQLQFDAVDVSPRASLRGRTPSVGVRGRFLDTTYSKTSDIGGGWTSEQGVRGRVRAEASTNGDSEVDLQAGMFREVRGPIGEDFQGRFRVEAGVRNRVAGNGSRGLRAGVELNQEVQGGSFSVGGEEFSLYADGRQRVFQNLEGGGTEWDYRFMAGPQKSIDVNALGYNGKVSVAAGPQISGSSDGSAARLGAGVRVGLDF